MPNPSWSTVVGIAKETTYGVGVPAVGFLPLTAAKLDDKLKYLEDKGWRGAPVDVYGYYPGAGNSNLQLDGNVYADTLPYLLAGVLGGVDTTGSAAPYTHVVTANNTTQPKSYTITDYAQGSIRQFGGVVFTETSLKIQPDALFTHSTKGVGQISIATTKPTISFSSVPTAAGWSVVPKINGTVATTLLDAQVDIKRPADVLLAVGTQTPYSVWPGLVDVSGKLDFVMEDETQLNAYLNGKQVALDLNLTQGTGGAATQVELHMSNCLYTTAVKERTKSYLTVQVNFSAVANTTDVGATGGYSPIKCTFQNAITSGKF